ncbi:MAG: histidinol dehydrogenase [Planctomycetales bacterium]|nr:histidinol dehydrogenase [Planctomycetales bacterium]
MTTLRIVESRDPARVEAFARLRGRAALDPAGGPGTPAETVREILADVRARGDEAVAAWTERLDGARVSAGATRVADVEVRAALGRTPGPVRAALEAAAEAVRAYQRTLVPAPSAPLESAGLRLETRVRPLDRVGVYVPGGRAAYPSTVIMTVVPARVAGVPEVVVCSPPTHDGRIADPVLAAAAVAGATAVHAIGGAQAIGALAYGTATVPRVDLVAGPGNLYVTLAKAQVFGAVDVDLLAGPTEVAVIADGTADPDWVAADLLAQAEHDPLAAAVLLTPERTLAERTADALESRLAALPRQAIARESVERQGLAVVTRDLDEAVALANELAPEHCQVIAREARRVADRVVRAGAVFVGPWSPEALGDYVAGPSHVLPTGGSARAFSGLSAARFLRRYAVVEASEGGLRARAGAIEALAGAEGLEGHAESVRVRTAR